MKKDLCQDDNSVDIHKSLCYFYRILEIFLYLYQILLTRCYLGVKHCNMKKSLIWPEDKCLNNAFSGMQEELLSVASYLEIKKAFPKTMVIE